MIHATICMHLLSRALHITSPDLHRCSILAQSWGEEEEEDAHRQTPSLNLKSERNLIKQTLYFKVLLLWGNWV